MTDIDHAFSEALDRLVPEPLGAGDWGRVARDARRRRYLFLAPAVVVAALAAAVLLWPSGGSPDILGRARAAIGDGPVIHVVLDAPGGTLVQLATDERTLVKAEWEAWYDPQRGLHFVDRFGGQVQSDTTWGPGAVPRTMRNIVTGIATKYPDALAQGTAVVAGEDDVDGTPVYWITIDDGDRGVVNSYELAISQKTYEPLVIRSRDGDRVLFEQRVATFETLPQGAGDFTASPPRPTEDFAFSGGEEGITVGEATAALGAHPLWLGQSLGSLDLTHVSRVEFRISKTNQERPRTATRGWDETFTGAEFDYGTRGETGKPEPPRVATIRVTESLHPEALWLQPPPIPIGEGEALVPPDGPLKMRSGNVWISIQASSLEQELAAARALQPMPG